MADPKAHEEELQELRQLEALLRAFVEVFDQQVAAALQRGSAHHPFAPQTVQLVEQALPLLQRLDSLRALDPAA